MSTSNQSADIVRTLGAGQTGRWAWLKWLLLVLVLGGVGFGGFRAFKNMRKGRETKYVTQPAAVASIDVVVTATGTLEAHNTVTVGTEVSGRVQNVLVDFNDAVTRGQVLIEIDPEQLRARVREARAQLAVTQASVQQAEATLAEARENEARVQRLLPQGFATDQERVTTRAARERAEATLANAHAQESVARAGLATAETSLSKTTIHSPIDGIVLDRAVEPGQTVNGSFQTPTLLTLAEDLTHMELHVDVDEADVGRVRVGQSATFTVSAYPGRTFQSRLVAMHNAPHTVDNVVTYEGVLEVNNNDHLLRPGMTSTVSILADRRENVLTVPNAALRFTPPQEASFRPPGGGRGESASPDERRLGSGRRVWILEQGKPKPIAVQTGATDGRVTEILSGNVRNGLELVIEAQKPKTP